MHKVIEKLRRNFLPTDISKIGKKIMVSYFVVIFVTTIAVMIVSRFSFNNLLNEQAKMDLKNDANMISEQITMAIDYQLSNSMYDNYPYESRITVHQKLFSDNSLGISGIIVPKSRVFSNNRFITTHIMVFDKEKKLIYSSDSESEMEYPNPDRSKFFVEERILSASDSSEPMGYLLMLAQKEDLGIIDKLIGYAALLGIAAALVVSILLSFFFERNIVSPINTLRKNISDFSLDDENSQWQDIETRDELSDINEDFRKLINKLKQYDKKQKEFFQNTSHELKTPLMSIQGYAEAIKDGVLEEESINEGLDIIIDESKRLRDTLTSIVYLGKVNDEGKKDIRVINLWEFMEDLKYKLTGISHEKSVQIINLLEPDLDICMSEEKLDRIFSNILSNALRYAQKKVLVESAQVDTGHVILTIEDDGKGFDEGEEEVVFDRFYKGKSGNTGLGLSIVKGIAESNGWAVRAVAAELGGACIEIVIPPKTFVRKPENE